MKQLKDIKELKQVRKSFAEFKSNVAWVKKMRRFGACNREIAVALNIPEDSPVLQR